MKHLFAIAILLIFSVTVLPQTSKVVVLKEPDAIEAKRLYNEMKAANERWEKFQERIATAYLPKGATSTCGGDDCWWLGGFTFDETFRFVLPKGSRSHGTLTLSPCTTISPLFTTSTGIATCAGAACN